jgi:diketogulonate reductase-like aldo/keto reductase
MKNAAVAARKVMNMTAKGPVLTLNNGVRMPAFGLGVFQSPPEQTANAGEAAIKHGYGLIDTAAAYFNEREVSEGMVRSGVPRRDVFVTTKLWMSDYGYDNALRAFDSSMRKLRLEYLDLYLLHWPVPSDFETTVASYKAAEKLLADGKVRAIGVCNFRPNDLQGLIDRTDVVPAVNQVELRPYFIQRELREADSRLGIVTQSWSPLGGVNVYHASNPAAVKNPLQNPTVATLAVNYGKTPAQIVLRWHIEHGLSTIPKSVRPERIAENIDIFDFALTRDDVTSIDAIDSGVRGGPDPAIVNPKLFPIKTAA